MSQKGNDKSYFNVKFSSIVPFVHTYTHTHHDLSSRCGKKKKKKTYPSFSPHASAFGAAATSQPPPPHKPPLAASSSDSNSLRLPSPPSLPPPLVERCHGSWLEGSLRLSRTLPLHLCQEETRRFRVKHTKKKKKKNTATDCNHKTDYSLKNHDDLCLSF